MSSSRFRSTFHQFRPPALIPTTIRTIQILAAYHLFTSTVCELRLCTGYSMLPTLSHEGDVVVISPLPYWFSSVWSSIPIPWSNPNSKSNSSSNSSKSSRQVGSSNTGKGPQRGDLIFAISPRNPRDTVCKRVVGIEGDIIEVDPRRGGGLNGERKWLAEEDRVYSSESHNSSSSGGGGSGGGHGEGRGEGNVDGVNRSKVEERSLDSEGRPLTFHIPAHAQAHGRRGEKRFVKVPKGHVWLAGDNMSNSTDSRTYGPVSVGMIKGKVLARLYPNFTIFRNPLRTISQPTPPTSASASE